MKNIRITLKTKIWLTVLSIVLMFSYFTLFYFPAEQERPLLRYFHNEQQNFANTLALGVKIAIAEQDYKQLQSVMEYLKEDPRLMFVSILVRDTIWDEKHTSFKERDSVLQTYPQSAHPPSAVLSNDSMIVKRAAFATADMAGAIQLAFSTREVKENQKKIRLTSILVSGLVLLIGIGIGFWLAKNISIPVLALRDAAKKVGQGDLSQKIKKTRNDEIGELGKAFNVMVDDLAANSALSRTLNELRATQAQLIQSEKMASLGELTAGIAHEIQNPLNFVNNFSELNAELIDEAGSAIDKGNLGDAKELLDSLRNNQIKINQHGQRAGQIVKSMLLHSRTSTGQKELTDINALANEYLRLSYQSVRAKDKEFNTVIKTNFEEKIEKIQIIPQEIGRVLLNLYNNAFYALSEKKKQHTASPAGMPAGALAEAGALSSADGSYEPAVTVTTKKEGQSIEISIMDNGGGIPENIRQKIFQPFFTTKPPGEGTGLGLSLSYDIVKAHGGQIKLESKEKEGSSEFVIQLPIT